jgi:hypothetical protein
VFLAWSCWRSPDCGLPIRHETRFHLDGVAVQGRVTGKQIAGMAPPSPVVASLLAHGGGGHRPRHVIDYEFVDAAGTVHVARADFSADQWNRIKIGEPIDVTYLRNDPGVSRVPGENRAPLPLIASFVAVGCITLYVSLRMFTAGVRRVRRNLELFQTGEPVGARIVEVVIRKGSKGRIFRTLHYCYLAPEPLSGRLESFSGTCPGTGWRGKSAERGDALLVCYDEHDPQRHSVDRYGLFLLDPTS